MGLLQGSLWSSLWGAAGCGEEEEVLCCWGRMGAQGLLWCWGAEEEEASGEEGK